LAILLAIAFCLGAAAQNQRVAGTVLDDDGVPVAGAYVQAESASGDRVGAMTDHDGNFVLSAVPFNSGTVTVSCLGMETVTLPMSSSMNITLPQERKLLDESIV